MSPSQLQWSRWGDDGYSSDQRSSGSPGRSRSSTGSPWCLPRTERGGLSRRRAIGMEALLRRRRQRARHGAPDPARRGVGDAEGRHQDEEGGAGEAVLGRGTRARCGSSSTRMGGTTTVAGPSSRADVELRDSPTPAVRSGGRRWLRQQQPWWLGQLGRHAVEQACSGRAATQQAARQSNTRQRQVAAWREGKANASKASSSVETRLRRAALLVAVGGKYLNEIRIECDHCSDVQQRQASGQR
jgi:hypothetical protein